TRSRSRTGVSQEQLVTTFTHIARLSVCAAEGEFRHAVQVRRMVRTRLEVRSHKISFLCPQRSASDVNYASLRQRGGGITQPRARKTLTGFRGFAQGLANYIVP